MQILIFIEPSIEKGWPGWRDLWLSMIYDKILRALRQREVPCRLLVGDAQEAAARALGDELKVPVSVITQSELQALFPDALTAMLAWTHDTAPMQRERMAALLHEKLPRYAPDIILNYSTPAPYLHSAWPRALVLHQEYGFLSRPPFPVSSMLDPCGLLRHSFLARFGGQLPPLPPGGAQFLARFRRFYCDSLIAPRNRFTRPQLCQGRAFRQLLLLPLQVAQTYAFEGQGPFTSQEQMLRHVLERAPHDTGVVVTEHTDWDKTLTPALLADLRAHYPHFLHDEAFSAFAHVSQSLLPLVDGVASLSSSLGLQAMIWRKPVCALGQSQLNAIADATDVADFCANMALKTDHDHVLYYWLKHCMIPANDAYLHNPDWLAPYLETLLARHRAGPAGVDFYPPIDSDERLLSHYRLHADRDIPKAV